VAIDRAASPYRRGTRYDRLPIPMIADHCDAVDAGAVQLVVETRRLTDEIIATTYDGAVDAPVSFDDGGPSLHVCGTADGLEYLRFDCFEQEPHYHYIEPTASANTVVRIDEVAVGDPVEFALACVEHRLAAMLRHCGAGELADAVDAQPDRVRAAMTEVRTLMQRAVSEG
jgi:hypothetical protein